MQKLFLTSSVAIQGVGESIRSHLLSTYPDTSKPLKTAFIQTPAEGDPDQDDLSWVEEERVGLNQSGFATFDYTITGKTLSQIMDDLKGIDVLYISGGNEFYLREKCHDSGFDKFVQEFVHGGGIYIGTSAGSIIAGQDMTALQNSNDLGVLSKKVDVRGFGLVNFTILPHWGSVDFRDRWLSNESSEFMYQENTPLIALNNYQYVEVIGDEWRVVDVRREE